MQKRFIQALVLTAIVFAGCREHRPVPESAATAIPVTTKPATMISSAEEISLSGNIEGYKTVRLGFMVAGKIAYIAVNEGQKVSKGQLIASLDPESYSIASEIAGIQVSQAEDEYKRLKAMYENGSLSESDYSKVTHGLNLARAQQKLHAKNLAETKLYSPIEGVLLKKLAEEGEITGTGLPVLVVSDIRKIKVNAFIPENELYKIRTGQEAEVSVSSLTGIRKGKVTEVGSAADAASRAFAVKIEIDNRDMILRPGMIAEVKIIPAEVQKCLVIPAVSVLHDYDDKSFVFVIDTTKNQAFRKNVSTGKLLNDNIEVLSGVTEGDIIVTGGQHKLADGSLITIIK